MAELKSYVCPNCGANTTNAQNCDYCGSLLVRFVERNIDLSGTSYLNNDKVIPGLIKHLEQNLILQQKNNTWVATDIYWKMGDGRYGSFSVMRQGKSTWSDGTDICITDQTQGLLVTLDFNPYIDPGYDGYNNYMMIAEEKFKKLPSFNLFTPHRCFYTDESGHKHNSSEYAIYFGDDVEGAARIVSEILEKVHDLNLNDNSIEIYTNSGDNISISRKEWRDNFFGRSSDDCYEDDDEDSTFSIFGIPWYWCLAAIFVFFSMISQCS